MRSDARARIPPQEPAKLRVLRALRSSTLFERASRATRDRAASEGAIAVVPSSAPLLEQGAAVSALHLVARGRARVERRASEARVVPLGYRGAGDVLGECVLTGEVDAY